MPVAGWGYGALLANRTSDFHALLYGHMATYQSRGSFHTTEQLSFLGSGLYRDFLHFTDPPVIPATSSTHHQSPSRHHLSAGYYAPEQDVSFCIVTQILTARLTRWQLVFEDLSRNIWFAKAAPDRWYEHGFGVSRAPTLCGNVSYTYSTNLTYRFRIERVSSRCMEGNVWFNFRWNHDISSVRIVNDGNIDVRLVQVERSSRISSVVLLGGKNNSIIDGDDNEQEVVAVEFSLISS